MSIIFPNIKGIALVDQDNAFFVFIADALSAGLFVFAVSDFYQGRQFLFAAFFAAKESGEDYNNLQAKIQAKGLKERTMSRHGPAVTKPPMSWRPLESGNKVPILTAKDRSHQLPAIYC